jgi:hypothetical protein
MNLEVPTAPRETRQEPRQFMWMISIPITS